MKYSKSEEAEVIRKLFYVVDVLLLICNQSNTVRKLKNHPIHDYTNFLNTLAIEGTITKREIEYQILEAIEYKTDFSNSTNQWIKSSTALVVCLLQEIIDGDYSLPLQSMKLK